MIRLQRKTRSPSSSYGDQSWGGNNSKTAVVNVGADGVHSVVHQFVAPDFEIRMGKV
ncbi:MAG: hypothetical protein ACKVHR_09545 [Pirellulales bacterium]|jgi:hypothetical protein